MSLLVVQPGLASRLVDFGRPRTRSLGVPVGGAADRRSLALGNALVGNPADAPALEIALKGPRLRADADVGCVFFGAPFELRRDGVPLIACQSFMLATGQELDVGGVGRGMRAYLCVCGGFAAPTVLDSCSGLDTIRAGDVLACGTSRIGVRRCPEVEPAFRAEYAIHVVPGLQADWFNEAEFYEQSFHITPANNRMGLRLAGQPLTMPPRELISEPVCPGAIQVTRDGQCIVLGMDGQTIGGYPKIAQVIQADLDSLGQLRPGDAIRFQKIQLDEAIERHRQAQAELQRWTTRLRLSLDALTTSACGASMRS